MEETRCPYCNSVARTDLFDTDSQTVHSSLCWCEFCGACEIDLGKSSYGFSGIETMTSWHLPSADSVFWDVAKAACQERIESDGIPF